MSEANAHRLNYGPSGGPDSSREGQKGVLFGFLVQFEVGLLSVPNNTVSLVGLGTLLMGFEKARDELMSDESHLERNMETIIQNPLGPLLIVMTGRNGWMRTL